MASCRLLSDTLPPDIRKKPCASWGMCAVVGIRSNAIHVRQMMFSEAKGKAPSVDEICRGVSPLR